jgi:hypothetical protein
VPHSSILISSDVLTMLICPGCAVMCHVWYVVTRYPQVGAAISRAITDGLVTREMVFIATKLSDEGNAG